MPIVCPMANTSTTWIALIRAIGPATHKLMSMAQLRDACVKAGFEHVRTVLATGNIIFSSAKPRVQVKQVLDQVIAEHGLSNEVILRCPQDLKAVLEINPFPDAVAARPNHVLVLFMEDAPTTDARPALAQYNGPERVHLTGRDVFIDYVEGVGRSKLTANRLERSLGRSGTARNWNTIQKLYSESQA